MTHTAAPPPEHLAPTPLFADRPLDDVLRDIATRDAAIQAWTWLPEAAPPANARRPGVLAGVAFGVKDIIDVAGMPTRCGALATDAEPKVFDAACVAQLREAGAIPLGKTVTAEFAFTTPGPTRNPHLLTHTPGGSSSGSAAAVAAGMVEMALGTQTGGSMIRPAAYCGVVGYKPTFGRIHRMGTHVLCDSLDTIGWYTRTVPQALAVASVLMPDALAAAPGNRPPKVAVLPCPSLGALTAGASNAMTQCVEALRAQGATLVFPSVDADIDEFNGLHGCIMRYELARGMLPVVRARGEQVSEPLRQAVAAGLAIDHGSYVRKQARRRALARKWADLFGDIDFIVAPSAPGEAPHGLRSTGSSVFNRLWSLLGWPCLHLPVARGDQGLPVGVQWIARHDMDWALLRWADALRVAGPLRQSWP
jgi:Asp-tRNA(Asn)/Glu-tRNA(Gln) amidotransferase A subunit family amidase